MTPWLITLRPFVLPHDGRQELGEIATGLTPQEYTNKIWTIRMDTAPGKRRSRSRAWPLSCRVKGKGFVIPKAVSNITPLKLRRKP